MIKSKNKHDEDFPVGWLTQKELQPLINSYYEAARLADDIADASNLSSDEKISQLSAIKRAFLIPKEGNDFPVIRNLGNLFVSEGLDASLFVDLLKAFESDSLNTPIRIWEELLSYCRFSAAPVGRFMLAIHNENISCYLPAENLCIILQILNHLGDIKDDLKHLNRCYIPLEMLAKYGIDIKDLSLPSAQPAVREMLTEIIIKLEDMLADVRILPSLISNFRLRAEVGVILSLTNSMIQKHKRVDVLQKSPRLNQIDWFKAVVFGVFRAMFPRQSCQGRVI